MRIWLNDKHTKINEINLPVPLSGKRKLPDVIYDLQEKCITRKPGNDNDKCIIPVNSTPILVLPLKMVSHIRKKKKITIIQNNKIKCKNIRRGNMSVNMRRVKTNDYVVSHQDIANRD